MAKLKRSAHRFFLNVAGSSSPSWFWVGKDIDDMSVDMNGSFDTKKNIWDETTVEDEGYTPEIGVSPYYANPDDPIYEFLLDLALGRKSGDDAAAEYLEVIVKDTADATHLAYKEDCIIEINSYGGDTTGMQIEYTVHPNGNRTKGTVKLTGKVPAFTESLS